MPKYLPAVPLDGLAAGAPLRYVPDPTKPLVYSVGQNGVDDGGSDRVLEKHAIRNAKNIGKWQRADCVIPLTRQPRPAPEE